MRYAMLGDIHGNYDALRAVLDDIARTQADRVICLGDIVGYGAEPAECIGAVREWGMDCIAGNHDLAVANVLDMQYFNDVARESVLWTRDVLSRADLAFLTRQPYERRQDGWHAVHGSFAEPEAFDYVLTLADARRAFEAMQAPVGFIGHSHVPMSFVKRHDQVDATMPNTIELGPKVSAIINVGSVGQPRDGNPCAAYAMYDTDAGRVTIRRVNYNAERAAGKVMKAGLPPLNAYRLLLGQ